MITHRKSGPAELLALSQSIEVMQVRFRMFWTLETVRESFRLIHVILDFSPKTLLNGFRVLLIPLHIFPFRGCLSLTRVDNPSVPQECL